MSASQYPNEHTRVLTQLLETFRIFLRNNQSHETIEVRLGRQAADELVAALDFATQPRIEGYDIAVSEIKMADLEKLAAAIGKKLVPK